MTFGTESDHQLKMLASKIKSAIEAKALTLGTIRSFAKKLAPDIATKVLHRLADGVITDGEAEYLSSCDHPTDVSIEIDNFQPLCSWREDVAHGTLQVLSFRDVGDSICSLQQSSGVEEQLWLGLDGSKPSRRMLIDKPMAKELIKRLRHWVDTGNLFEERS